MYVGPSAFKIQEQSDFHLNVNCLGEWWQTLHQCGGHIPGCVARESRKPAIPLPCFRGTLRVGNQSSIQGSDVSSCSRGEKDKCPLLREGLSGHLVVK